MSISRLLESSKKALFSGKERTVKAKKNILGSIAIKMGSIAVSFLMVPMTIEYVSTSSYGVWLTLSSIVAWFGFFDIGLTNGLRNKLAIANAKGNTEEGSVYVSTTYAILGIMFLSLWVIFLLVNQFLDWSKILNVEPAMRHEVTILAVIVFTYFCINFVLKTLNTIIISDQRPAKASLMDLAGQILSLLFIFVLIKTTEGSLVNLGVALCLSPILVYILANIFYFNRRYRHLKPRLSRVNFKHSKGLLSLGLKFFVIQIAALVQFQTANFIIAQNFGTLEVTNYNVVYKYFSFLGMGFGILLSPFWTASTEAYVKNDIAWIKKSVKRYLVAIVGVFLVGLAMLLGSEKFYDLWLKGRVSIDFNLSLWGFIFFFFFAYSSIFVNFLNGISALRIQFWTSLVSPIVYMGIALTLIKYFDMGVYSLFVSSFIAAFNGWLIAPVQYFLIIYKGKKGIWVK